MLEVEAKLEELSRGDPQNNFYQKYDVLKKRLLHHEYHFTLSNFPGGNDHGPNHIRRVLEYLDKLLSTEAIDDLNVYELFILLMSALYHDIGLLQGRQEHAETSESLVARDVNINNYLVNRDDVGYISSIVCCHSEHGDIAEKLKQFQENEPVRGFCIRPRFLAALLRFADALDEDTRRADQLVEDKSKIPLDSTIYWKINQKIRGIKPIPDQRTVEFNIKFDSGDLTADHVYQGSCVSVLEAVVKKLEEINAERKYCMAFKQGHFDYTSLASVFTQLDDVSKSALHFSFADLTQKGLFFKEFPELSSHGKSAVDERIHPGVTDDEKKRIQYLKSVADECQWVDFKGIPVPGGVLRVEVEKVYIELRAVQSQEEGRYAIARKSGRSRRRLSKPDIVFQYPTEERGQKTGTVLASNKQVVILGDPGSGKTTLLRYIGFHCAYDKAKEKFHFDHEVMPIYLPLREYAAALSEKPGLSLANYLGEYLTVCRLEPCLPLIQEKLEAGLCILLLDGLDEVATTDLRIQVASKVEELVTSYSDNRFIVTSRIVGYREAQIQNHFTHYVIEPFSQDDIEFFIDRWCNAVELECDRDREKTALTEAIFASDRVTELALNPLFVTILAKVHRTYRVLPQRKPLLYAKCAEALLTTMDMSRNMQTVFSDERIANRIMGSLALYIHDQMKGQFITRKQILSQLTSIDGGPRTEDEASSLLWRIEERGGLLVERGPDRFAFSRLTFQEYYVAKELVSRRKQDEALEKHITDPRWREALVIVAGILDEIGEPYVLPYVEKVLDYIEIPSKSQLQESKQKAEKWLIPLSIAIQCAVDRIEAGDGFNQKLAQLLYKCAKQGVNPWLIDINMLKFIELPPGKILERLLTPLLQSRDAVEQRGAVLFLYRIQSSDLDRLRFLLTIVDGIYDKLFCYSAYTQILRLAKAVGDSSTRRKMRTQLRALPVKRKREIIKNIPTVVHPRHTFTKKWLSKQIGLPESEIETIRTSHRESRGR